MSAPPGWYDDPSMVNTRRYWDGAKWTEHRQEMPPPAAPVSGGKAAPVVSPEAERKARGWAGLGFFCAVFIPVLGLVIGLVLRKWLPREGMRIVAWSLVMLVVYAVLLLTGVIGPSHT